MTSEKKDAHGTALDSYFAPAERAPKEVLQRQLAAISESSIIGTFLSVLAGIVVVLNEYRQIIGINHAYLEFLGIKEPETALGLRLGESVGCTHAHEMPGGCGTSQSCASCGAVIAMMASLESGDSNDQICALQTSTDGVIRQMALEVRTTPLVLQGEKLLVVTLRDATKDQLRRHLERVFFHDINNVIGTLLGPSELLLVEMPKRWEVMQINAAALRLRQELALQRQLCLEKEAGFIPDRQLVSLREIGKEVQLLMGGHPAADNKIFTVSHESEDCLLLTDKHLVGRVLTNMLLNAFEATVAGGEVRLTTRSVDDRVVWEVWNDAFIPEAIQSRIFQRHFSTKSDVGRGLGTSSMKLFGECYLGGTLRFTSSKDSGTIFTFSLPVRS